MDINFEKSSLIEAVFEIRWVPPPSYSNPFTRDPFFYVHVNTLLPRLKAQFPCVQSLLPPNTAIPEEILQSLLHYKLLSAEKQTPLVQLGPGVLTLNANESYSWHMFHEKLKFVLQQLYDSRPDLHNSPLECLSLKYLNFFECGYTRKQITDFFKRELDMGDLFPAVLSREPRFIPDPISFNFSWQYPCTNSTGDTIGSIIFSTSAGEKSGKKGVFTEIEVQMQKQSSVTKGRSIELTSPEFLPRSNESVLEWAVLAHKAITDCFFTVIKNHTDKSKN
jgi:uncharacterized protein (TIGR04255 family)